MNVAATHLAKNHGRDLLGGEDFVGAIDLDLDNGLVVLRDDPVNAVSKCSTRLQKFGFPAGYLLEGEVLDIKLNVLLRELTTDEALDVEDSVVGVGGSLVLGCVSDKSLILGEGDIRGGDTVSLVIDENLDLALLHHTDTAIVPVSIAVSKDC